MFESRVVSDSGQSKVVAKFDGKQFESRVVSDSGQSQRPVLLKTSKV